MRFQDFGLGICILDANNVNGRRTLGALFDPELDSLSFLQAAKTSLSLDGREMNKDVPSGFTGNESIALDRKSVV